LFETNTRISIGNKKIKSRSDNIDLVSVIIPNYNQAQYVSSSITSVLKQTYPNYEIIVVDDGSTDNSRKVLSKFDRKIRYIWQENKGLAGARNTGIQAAKGKYVGLLDADDEWLPTYLEEMVSFADQNPEAGVFYCQAQAMDSDGKDLPQIFGGPVLPPEQIYQTILRANFIIPTTILMRRQVITQAGLFDQSLRSCEDWDLWLRLLPTHEIIGKKDVLVKYRIHGTSLSTDPTGMQKATKLVVEKHFGHEDGDWKTWSFEKRRAYGGMYRYHLLTSVQRKADWGIGPQYLSKALVIDPSLAVDLDLFYELTFGTQPIGFRGSKHRVNLEENIENIRQLLSNTFTTSSKPELISLRHQTFGTAYYAIGLVAYNYGEMKISRNNFIQALYYRPELFWEKRVSGNILKSCLNEPAISLLKKAKEILKNINPISNSRN
jgi:glycosyltransferase involved in cell wall biosynthesis